VRVAASGYFDPLHVGHIEYLKKAKALGDELVVIINNDEQCKLKKGIQFMNEKDRAAIVNSLKCVDGIIISLDKDLSVCETLKKIKPDIFANGGDRNHKEVPEASLCRELKIKMVDGLGKKIRSSSKIVKKKMLNLGSGDKPLQDFINIDKDLRVKPDVVADVEKGLPFEESSIDFVYSEHFMEHVQPDKIDFVLFEIWRVLKPGAEFRCVVPINKALFASPYHKSLWNEYTPIFFTDWNRKERTGYEFRLKHKELTPCPNIYSQQLFFQLEAIKEEKK
jgi:cytidyltransferase-like protein